MVSDLTAAGIPATIDPATVWAMASAGDVVALVDVPDEVRLTKLPRSALRMTVPVHIIAGGSDVDGYNRLLDVLPTALRVLHPIEPARPIRHTRGEASLPAYTIECPRDVEE